MKKTLSSLILSLAASLIFSGGLLAQEQTEVSIKVTKDGKVIQDTTYRFDNASDARDVVKMIEVLNGDDEGNHSKTMVFISEDDENTFDILVDGDFEEGNWTVFESEEGNLDKEENVEVIVIKKQKKEKK